MVPRFLTRAVLDALRDTPVVILHGPRQSGKSTLARHIAATEHPARYITLDRVGVLAAARQDPEGFLANLAGDVVIDEVQRAPELLLAIKAQVDENRRPGRYLLTGSADALCLPRFAHALVGRMEALTLWPFSRGEILRHRGSFIDTLFAPDWARRIGSWTPRAGHGRRDQIVSAILTGGFPEIVTARTSPDRRRNWFESYIQTLLLRDVLDLSRIEGVTDLPRFLATVADRATGLLNYADLGRDVGANGVRTKRYLSLLQSTFAVQTLKPWFSNRTRRLMKSEKVYLGDTGLLCHLLGADAGRLREDGRLFGRVLENYVMTELVKQRAWSRTRPDLLHFRGYDGTEVDLVLEAPGAGRLAGVEVKATTTLGPKDFKGLRILAEAAGPLFQCGIVLYGGSEVIPFGTGFFALPLQSLWALGSDDLPV